jgi:hypothetical protein
VNSACKLFSRSCLGLAPMTRAQAQAGEDDAWLRRDPSNTTSCFTLGGAT